MDNMEDFANTEKHGGIVNHFGGATIHNLVINGNMNKNGNEYYGDQSSNIPVSAYTDEVVGNAILTLNGLKKPLCEKQLFLGIIKVLSAKCGWSSKWATSCERINHLPAATGFEVKCDANNLKAPSALKFASLDYQEWEDYVPSPTERDVFNKNKTLAKLFEEELDKQVKSSY